MDNELIKIVKNDKFADYIGAKLVKVEIGYAVAQMEIEEKHLNGAGIVQGGATFTLADYAFAAACNAAGVTTLAINVTISFFKPPKGKILTAEAKQVSASRRICSYNVDVTDENGNLVARFIGTGYIKGEK